MLIDRESFNAGYRSKLKEAGFGDDLWNNTLGTFGKHGAGTKMLGNIKDTAWNSATDAAGKFINDATGKAMNNGLDKTINQAGQQLGAGTLNGAIDAGGQRLSTGWNDMKKSFTDYGKGLMNNPMDTIKNNPWLSGGLAVGGLGLGYTGGKMLGLWGNNTPSNGQSNNNVPSNGQPSSPPMMQSAYTQGFTPMALQKASAEFPIPAQIAPILSPSINVGSSIYRALNPATAEPNTPEAPNQVVVNPADDRVNKLLKNPKMRAYISNLVNSTGV